MDIKNLKSHIKDNDLFGTLATILRLHKETNEPIKDELIDNLVYLQDNHRIK